VFLQLTPLHPNRPAPTAPPTHRSCLCSPPPLLLVFSITRIMPVRCYELYNIYITIHVWFNVIIIMWKILVWHDI
jgi:hypothetical protein